MIPERTGVTVDSTVQGEDVAMTIDQSALAHIMNVLTDLYADAELACLREYSTNALDSHVEAGQTRPIEVATPTELRPLFTVRDYGVGLNAEDIRNIYSRYGASTKRASNDAVGMLGLGCKSALAYCDQFTLCGIKDGHRILVSIARDETGAGTMTVLESGETDEPNGVEVCIPATADSEFEAKAVDFFAYWQPGLVRLNGQAPDELSGYRVGESYIVADRVRNAWDAEGRHDYRPLTIVMGNVSYPPPDGFQSDAVDTLPADKRLVVTVPIGAVHFTPSREGLHSRGEDDGFAYQSSSTGQAIVNGEVYSGNIPNGVGATVEMPRSDVQHNPSQGCSTGLHVGTYKYAQGYARGALLTVLVNPRDVVSVPSDCNAEKMRVCRYVVSDDEPTPPEEAGAIAYDDEPDETHEPETIEHDGQTYHVIERRPAKQGETFWNEVYNEVEVANFDFWEDVNILGKVYTNTVSDAIPAAAYVETGEVRHPVTGEFYLYGEDTVCCAAANHGAFAGIQPSIILVPLS